MQWENLVEFHPKCCAWRAHPELSQGHRHQGYQEGVSVGGALGGEAHGFEISWEGGRDACTEGLCWWRRAERAGGVGREEPLSRSHTGLV